MEEKGEDDSFDVDSETPDKEVGGMKIQNYPTKAQKLSLSTKAQKIKLTQAYFSVLLLDEFVSSLGKLLCHEHPMNHPHPSPQLSCTVSFPDPIFNSFLQRY